jgi:hypothetical protein
MFKASIVFGLLRQKFGGDTYQAPDDLLFLNEQNVNTMNHGDNAIQLAEDAPQVRKVKEGVCQQVAGLEVFDLA